MKRKQKLIHNVTEAIDCLKSNKPTSGNMILQESIDMAIQALEKQKYLYNDSVDKKAYYEDIHVIGEYKDIAIYLIHDNGKRIYEHGLKPLESFNTLAETIYDIEVTLLNILFWKGAI